MVRRVILLPVLLVVLLAGRRGGPPVEAQAVPPMRVYGAVTIDGATAASGTVVEAVVSGATCGTDRSFGGQYVIEVTTALVQPWCAYPGAEITFRIDGVPARERAIYEVGAFSKIDIARAQLPPLDPSAGPARFDIVQQGDAKLVDIPDSPIAHDVTLVNRFHAVPALAAVYPATPAGTASVYVIAPTGAIIDGTAGTAGHCSRPAGYPNILACTVERGAVISFGALGS